MSTRRRRSRKSIGQGVGQTQGPSVGRPQLQPPQRHQLRSHPRLGVATRAEYLRLVREGGADLFPDVLDAERFEVEAFVSEFMEEFPDAGLRRALRQAERAFPAIDIGFKQMRDILDDLEGLDRSHGRTRRAGQRGGRHMGRGVTYMLGTGLLPGDVEVGCDEQR